MLGVQMFVSHSIGFLALNGAIVPQIYTMKSATIVQGTGQVPAWACGLETMLSAVDPILKHILNRVLSVTFFMKTDPEIPSCRLKNVMWLVIRLPDLGGKSMFANSAQVFVSMSRK